MSATHLLERISYTLVVCVHRPVFFQAENQKTCEEVNSSSRSRLFDVFNIFMRFSGLLLFIILPKIVRT